MNRWITHFDKITVNGPFIIQLQEGSADEIVINADENILDLVETNVINGQLMLQLKQGYNLKNGKSIIVTIPKG